VVLAIGIHSSLGIAGFGGSHAASAANKTPTVKSFRIVQFSL
jgi:hypothetical protein